VKSPDAFRNSSFERTIFCNLRQARGLPFPAPAGFHAAVKHPPCETRMLIQLTTLALLLYIWRLAR